MQLNELRARVRIRTRAREFASALRDNRTAAKYAGWREDPIVPGSVLYESFFGNGILDNPEAIFRHLLDQPDQRHLKHIWVLDDVDAHPEVTAEFAGDSRVRFVGIETPEYLHALATSQYLVNNATFPQEFAKRPGQTYVNTWHGVPLKHMGYDMRGGGIESRNVSRNFLQADYLVSANSFMTDTMYRKGYRLQGIFRGSVIEEGQPRIDRQIQAMEDPAPFIAQVEAGGVVVDGRKIVLFAPTWRGDSFGDPHVNAAEMVRTVRQLQKALGEEYVVLLKTHQVVHNAVKKRLGQTNFLVPNDIATNLLLGVSDLLVTDYSSIFFDYLATGRPIVHYVPDLDDYEVTRGLYLEQDELFGPFCKTIAELAEHVEEGLAGDGRSALSVKGAERFNAKDDGNATARLVDIVFRGVTSGYTVHSDFGTEKERICIYLGSMMSNGIMTSALNLLHNLDYDKYDVTAFWAFSVGRDRARNAGFVDPRARVIPRATVMNGGPLRVRRIQSQMLKKGLPATLSAAHHKFWGDEYQRMFGNAEFDHLIDFSGYGCYSPFLFSSAPGSPRKSIWLHNDMAADQQRETVGEKHLEARLGSVFSTYRHFDHLVSVSPELMRLNRENLAAYASPEKFEFALNTIDGERVLRMAGRLRDDATGADDTAGTGHLERFDTTNVAAAVHSLMQYFKAGEIIREARSRQRINTMDIRGKKVQTFVTVGRLSPEKNHARLIEAFAQVHSKHPDIRLVILGGGKLEGALADQISNLGMEPFISLAGQVDNPFAILADADCFVLSSDYEGQPMVILEARALGLPVITTSFSSVGDSVPEDAGIVVPKSVKGVAAGLERYLAGEVPTHPLDYREYNAAAAAQFSKAIGSRTVR
ncbi:MAG: glycosyltransferase [Marmoricola sp.]